MSPQSCYVVEFPLEHAEKLKQGLIDQGFTLSCPPHSLFGGKKKGVSCTLYQSGKLTVQGKEKGDFIQFYLEPEILGQFTYGYEEQKLDTSARVGIDEAGKGDFFGPLCVAGLYAEGQQVHDLHALGVQDSKNLNDEKVRRMAKEIRARFTYSQVCIGPRRYNELYGQFRNLNRLLAWGHATAIEKILQQRPCERVIVDQFAAEHVVATALKKKNLSPHLEQRHRAESDIVVAGASILARASFLEQLEALGKEIGFVLPKGASKKVIEAGCHLLQRSGEGVLDSVSKSHFKTRTDIIMRG